MEHFFYPFVTEHHIIVRVIRYHIVLRVFSFLSFPLYHSTLYEVNGLEECLFCLKQYKKLYITYYQSKMVLFIFFFLLWHTPMYHLLWCNTTNINSRGGCSGLPLLLMQHPKKAHINFQSWVFVSKNVMNKILKLV